MISDRRMKYIKSEEGLDYYLFYPSLIRQYYNKTEEWTPHRRLLTHKIHMFLLFLIGRYKILYVMKENQIITYVAFAKCSDLIVRGSGKKDILTIFITTNPSFRKRGYATKALATLLYDIGLDYERAFETISDTNIASIKTATYVGYKRVCAIKKTRVFKVVVPVIDGTWSIYQFNP